MNLLSRRSVLAIAAVVDVALHSRSAPVAARALAWRHKLPPRPLEKLLQGLVHANILKGVRGPHGGYELARERRRITVGEIVRTAISLSTADPEDLDANSALLERVIDPAVRNYDIHTSLDACAMGEVLTPWGNRSWEADMELGFGRFGDARLEKGGSFCTPGLWRAAARARAFASLAAIGRARCGSAAFCTIGG